MTENWLPVVGHEGFYEVSNLGRVKSMLRICSHSTSGATRTVPEKILKPDCKRGEYLCVTLSNGSIKSRKCVHNLVAEAFLGPKPSSEFEVCHDDGSRHNNRADNLRYDTRAGNFSDKLKHGTHNRGERHHKVKLSDEQVLEIRAIGRSISQEKIAKIYGVKQTSISNIILGRRRLTSETFDAA